MCKDEVSYYTLCDRICAYVMAYELGIHIEWDLPILRPHPHSERYGAGVHEDLRLSVKDGQVSYYQRSATSGEREVKPEGALEWLADTFTLHPRVTEEQLQAAEVVLGFSLPPFLRTLYKRVGNGGFGPGYDGIFHLPGKEEYECWPLLENYAYQKADKLPIDLSFCHHRPLQRQQGDKTEYLADWEIFVPQTHWPERFLPLCQLGCSLYYYLDIRTDRVYLAGSDYMALHLVANSLAEILERWMLGLVR